MVVIIGVLGFIYLLFQLRSASQEHDSDEKKKKIIKNLVVVAFVTIVLATLMGTLPVIVKAILPVSSGGSGG